MRATALILILFLVVMPSEIPLAVAQGSEGEITFQPSEMPNIGFTYNAAEYRFELTWKTYYLNIKPFAIYNGQYRELKQIIPFLKNQFPNVDYRTAVNKFKNYHRWGFWLEKLPQNVADNLDYLGFDVSDNNIPMSAVEVEEIQDLNVSYKRINIGSKFSLDFLDLYERGFEVEINRTTILVGKVRGKTDLDLDPITYSHPLITVTGYTEETPCTFWDIWNASNVNGWDVVHNNELNDTQYQFDTGIRIGDGGTSSWFADTNKQISWYPFLATAGYLFYVHHYAHATFGELINENTREVQGGIHWLDMNTVQGNIYTRSLGNFDIYGSTFFSNNFGYHVIGGRIWHCKFVEETSIKSGSRAYVYSTSFSNAPRPVFYIDQGDPEIFYKEQIWIDNQYLAYLSGVYSMTVKDAVVTNNLYICNGVSITVDSFLIDVTSDSWDIAWSGTATAEIYRQYTANFLVVDREGNPIQGADVTLTYEGQGGGTAYTGTIPANGSIPEQTISKGFYNQTGDDTIYSYEPYNLTISLTGYETTSFIFNVSNPINWIVPLVEESLDVVINNDMVLWIFFVLSLITMIGMLIAENPVVSVSAAALAFICWGVTGLVYLYDNYDYPGPALLFGLLATISLIYALFIGLKLLDPYFREGLASE